MEITNEADAMIESCITGLTENNFNGVAKRLGYLAVYWAQAGLNLQSFLDMRTYIINMAEKQSDILLIEEKLRLAEKELREYKTPDLTIH